jgi:hypothetical protein
LKTKPIASLLIGVVIRWKNVADDCNRMLMPLHSDPVLSPDAAGAAQI